LHFTDSLLSVYQAIIAIQIFVFGYFDFLSFFSQQLSEGTDKLQVTGWSDVVVASELPKESLSLSLSS